MKNVPPVHPVAALAGRVKAKGKPAVDVPQRASFEEFLLKDARVPDSKSPGNYMPFAFEGREVLRAIVRRIDHVIAHQITDAKCGVAGGAQFGKTILELNLTAYLTAQRFLRVGLFLPSDDLVQGVVDTKMRPDVIEQIPWLAEMTQVGKAVNKSGKAVNRKGAFMVTDGQRSSYAMVLGLQKIPTTFTVDVAAQDEVDDIPPKTAKFVKGRMTSSPLRFSIQIGTQRVAGRGQNKVWKDGSQGVALLGPKIFKNTHQPKGAGSNAGSVQPSGDDDKGVQRELNAATRQPAGSSRCIPDTGLVVASNRSLPPPSAGPVNLQPGDETDDIPHGWLNPEEEFPQIVRRQLGDAPHASDPKMTWAGTFHREGDDATWAYARGARYYLAHPDTGAVLDRSHPLIHHRVPAKLDAEDWTIRIAQLSIAAISLDQILQQFCEGENAAVNSPDAMTVFRCDVLGLPQSTAQAITPAIVERAQNVAPFLLRKTREAGRPAYGGLDVGDQCWFFTRERESALRKRCTFAAKIPAADMVKRAVSLFHTIGLTALFIDQRPLVSESRAIALELNELAGLTVWPQVPKNLSEAYMSLPGGLTWDGRSGRWRGLRAAVVRFDVRSLGKGIQHGFDQFEQDGVTKFVPLINCNRFETIDRVVRELLTPAEGVSDIIGGALREDPALLLPSGSDPMIPLLTAHLVTGSERDKDKDGGLGEYVDGCENHELLADGYSALAEMECGDTHVAPAVMRPIATSRRGQRMRDKRERSFSA